MRNYLQLSRSHKIKETARGTAILMVSASASLSLALSSIAQADSTLDTLCSTQAMASNYSGNSTQAQQYCAAGQAAEKAASADGDVWIIYAAAATVCTTACAMSMFQPPSPHLPMIEMACTGASVGAGVDDALQTGSYMSALTSIVGAAGVPLFNYLTGTTTTIGSATGAVASGIGLGGASSLGAPSTAGLIEPTGSGLTAATDPALNASSTGSAASNGTQFKPSGASLAACLSAASNAYSAYSKHGDEESSQATVNQSIQELEALKSNNATTTLSANTTQLGLANAGSTLAAASGSTTGASLGSGSAAPTTAAAAQTSCSGGSGANGAQCAATAGAVPIMTPPLANALQAVTGMTPDQYAQNAAKNGPGAAISSGLGSGAAPFASKLDELASAGGLLPDSATYTAGGSHGSSGGDGLDKAMGSLLEQFGKKKDDGKPLGVSSMSFGKRSLASTNPENDPNATLFARVAYRYTSLTPGLLGISSDNDAPLPELPFAK